MTSKEKAKEIYGKFFRKTPQPFTTDIVGGETKWKDLQFENWDSNWTYDMALGHSLIMVDEILTLDIVNPFREGSEPWHRTNNFWKEVKEELIKIGKNKLV